MDYQQIKGLRLEAAEKLSKVRPEKHWTGRKNLGSQPGGYFRFAYLAGGKWDEGKRKRAEYD